MFRAGLEAMLGADPDVTVVGALAEPNEGGSVRELVAELDADVVVWVRPAGGARGSALPDEDEPSDARMPALVLLADVADASAARRALRGGASALLPLGADGELVVAAVRAAAAGLVTVTRERLAELLPADGGVRDASGAVRTSSAVTHTSLTPREREVLALLGQGLANKAIAPRLGITEHTVKAHVAAIYEKLGAGNRAEVVMAAARAGLLLL